MKNILGFLCVIQAFLLALQIYINAGLAHIIFVGCLFLLCLVAYATTPNPKN